MVLSSQSSSRDMTSGSSTINSAILKHFDGSESNCDAMPACIATSFPHISNEVYKREYARAEQASESSSPDMQEFEVYNKSYQYSNLRHSPDNLNENATRYDDECSEYGSETDDVKSTVSNSCHGDNNISRSRPENLDKHSGRRVKRSDEADLPVVNCVGNGWRIDQSFVSRENKPSVATSPSKKDQPLKKRLFYGGKTQQDFFKISPSVKYPEHSSEIELSPLPTANSVSSMIREKSSDSGCVNSGDILRRMYAVFGSAGSANDSLTRFNQSAQARVQGKINNAQSDLKVDNDNNKPECSSDERIPTRKRKHSQHDVRTNLESFNKSRCNEKEVVESRTAADRATTRRTGDHCEKNGRCFSVHVQSSEDREQNESKLSPRKHSNQPSYAQTNTNGNLSRETHNFNSNSKAEKLESNVKRRNMTSSVVDKKTKRSLEFNGHRSVNFPCSNMMSYGALTGNKHSPPKRKYSHDGVGIDTSFHKYQAKKSLVANGSHVVDHISSSSGPKRGRYSSSDSNESQVNGHPQNMIDLHKQREAASIPGINPLLYQQQVLAAFGLSGTAGVPFGLTALPQGNLLGAAGNPLMLGANPYLAKSLLLREMMQAQASNIMSLFPSPHLASLPMNPGFNLEQLQAFQQFQNPALYQIPSPMLNPGMLSSAALSAMKKPMFHAMGRSYDYPVNENRNEAKTHPNHIRISESHSNDEELNNKISSQKQTNKVRLKSERSTSPISESPKEQKVHIHQRSTSSKRITPEKNRTLFSDKQQFLPNLHKEVTSQASKSKKAAEICRTPTKPTSTKPASPKLSVKRSEKKNSNKPKSKGYNNSKKTLEELTKTLPLSSCSLLKDVEGDYTSGDSPELGGFSMSNKSASYKNLTRERRLVANARERTRVHTISSAFDELRSQIPSYSCNQKLSKLAILRIACSYIRTLSVLAGRDETTTFSQGVDQCTKVLQSESRARSRRKSNKAQIEWEMVNYERHKGVNDVDSDEEERHTELPVKTYKNSHAKKNSMSTQEDRTPSVASTYPTHPNELESNDDVMISRDDQADKYDIVDVESVDERVEVLEDVTNRNPICDVTSVKSSDEECEAPDATSYKVNSNLNSRNSKISYSTGKGVSDNFVEIAETTDLRVE